MKKEELKIVFMGTPDFAVESLRALVENGYNVVAVVTQPDKPVGRHRSVLQAPPVKQYAVSMGLPVLQPEKMKDEAFLAQLRSFEADLQIVVAFRMLPEVVWAMPPFGTFNLHASLLPRYRGAAPINWAIINGDTETGITTFFLQHDIDTGEIIRQERVPIGEEDDVEAVHDRLMMLGSKLVLQTVDDILSGTVTSRPQSTFAEQPTPAPKLFKDNTRIDWNTPARAIHDFVRGLSPVPVAWTEMLNPDGTSQEVRLFETRIVADELPLAPGEIYEDGHRLLVGTASGTLSVLSLQMSGKRRMPIRDFLCGFRFTGQRFA